MSLQKNSGCRRRPACRCGCGRKRRIRCRNRRRHKPHRRPQYSKRPVRRVKPCGCKQRQQTKFIETEKLDITTGNDWSSFLLVNSSLLSMYSYAIVNRGANPAEVMVEISPNGKDFMMDSKMDVPAASMQTITPLRYLKYTRFSVKSREAGRPTSLDLYFQGQTAG